MDTSNIRRRQLGTVEGIDIWVVDGECIRNTVDTNFTNFSTTCDLDYIPDNELWVDAGDPKELPYFIASGLAIHGFIRNGWSYKKALKAANRIEEHMRLKNAEQGFKPIYCNYVGSLRNVKVWVVFGASVRLLFDRNFTEGGHSLVYPYIPKDMIWLDNTVKRSERKPTIVHEYHEMMLMKDGMPYAEAHSKALKFEKKFRPTS